MNARAGGTDPGSKSAAEIEREVQQSRAEVEQTLDAIQARLSPGQLLDQAVGYFREGRGVDFARNLGDSITQNPIPLALVGVGLAWMMLGGQRSGHPGGRLATPYWDDDPDAFEDDRYVGLAEESTAYRHSGADLSESGYGDERGGLGDDLRETSQAVQDKLGELGDQVGSAAARAREGVAHAGAKAARRAQDVRARAGHYGRRARHGVLRTLDEQPLVLGALGLALGAALGAALPPSETEDRLMGEARDEALRHATKAGREQVEKAGAAAGAVAQAARAEADKQGLMPESSTSPSTSGPSAAASEAGSGATRFAGPAADTPYPADPKAGLDRP
ncbi:MAG TPA: DUF3618 domain-containing protein [Geminicoccaceae bacterium]|nr:DUF3618 domain-containing protein [Geminicoccaceae bacterium]